MGCGGGEGLASWSARLSSTERADRNEEVLANLLPVRMRRRRRPPRGCMVIPSALVNPTVINNHVASSVIPTVRIGRRNQHIRCYRIDRVVCVLGHLLPGTYRLSDIPPHRRVNTWSTRSPMIHIYSGFPDSALVHHDCPARIHQGVGCARINPCGDVFVSGTGAFDAAVVGSWDYPVVL